MNPSLKENVAVFIGDYHSMKYVAQFWSGERQCGLFKIITSSQPIYIADKRERIRIRAAPRLFTSSIFKQVYTFPDLVRMSFTQSVVTASRPHPKEFNWIKSRLFVVFT